MVVVAVVAFLSGTELGRFAGRVQMCWCCVEVTYIVVNSMDGEKTGNLYWPTDHNCTMRSILASSLSFNLRLCSSVLAIIRSL